MMESEHERYNVGPLDPCFFKNYSSFHACAISGFPASAHEGLSLSGSANFHMVRFMAVS